ncbi:MAG: hypothetical protein WBD75_01810 [Phycisphaerae bacterium]
MTFISNILLVIVTVLLVVVTYYLKKATDLQSVTSMTVAFQNEWHSRIATLMRDYLHSETFNDVFNAAIESAYGKSLDYKNIDKLLSRNELNGIGTNRERLTKLENCLREAKYEDPLRPGEPLFSAYEAVYQVLLSFDRLAVLRDEPQIMKKFIIKYKPPIRDLAPILQAFIAIRILLREPKFRNYKKDYMLLLRKLRLENNDLLKVCKEGLKARQELTDKELKEADKI